MSEWTIPEYRIGGLTTSSLKVLDLVRVTAELENESLPLKGFLDYTSSGEVLGFSDLPRSFKQKYGQHAMGVKRTTLNLKLKDMLIEMGVEVREGWQLEDIEEGDASVTAHFSGGRSVTGVFLIGGDGIKAASRRILLKRQGLVEGLPPLTGLSQVGVMNKNFEQNNLRSIDGRPLIDAGRIPGQPLHEELLW